VTFCLPQTVSDKTVEDLSKTAMLLMSNMPGSSSFVALVETIRCFN